MSKESKTPGQKLKTADQINREAGVMQSSSFTKTGETNPNELQPLRLRFTDCTKCEAAIRKQLIEEIERLPIFWLELPHEPFFIVTQKQWHQFKNK